MTEKISRDDFEAYLRRVCDGERSLTYEQFVEFGWTIKPCDCNYGGCQGWIFTCDDPLTMLRTLHGFVQKPS